MTVPHLPPLSIDTQRPGDGSAVLRVHGELDHETVPDLLDAVEALLSDARPPDTVELELSALGACDSSGLSALIVLKRRTEAAGVTLRMSALSDQLLRIIRVTGTEGYFAPVLAAGVLESEADGGR